MKNANFGVPGKKGNLLSPLLTCLTAWVQKENREPKGWGDTCLEMIKSMLHKVQQTGHLESYFWQVQKKRDGSYQLEDSPSTSSPKETKFSLLTLRISESQRLIARKSLCILRDFNCYLYLFWFCLWLYKIEPLGIPKSCSFLKSIH